METEDKIIMETIENGEIAPKEQEHPDSSVLDVENIEDNPEISTTEDNVSQDEEPLANESAPLTESSSINVRGKENLPPEKRRLVRLPLARIKHLMKMDPDCTIVGQETVFLVTKATEMFLDYLGKESVKYTQIAKRKTVLKRDVEAAIDSISHLCFLEGALE